MLMVITLTIFWMGACGVNGYQVIATPTASLIATPALDVYTFDGTFVPTPSLPPTAYAVASQLQHRWLSGLPCRLPCWEGITPGTTSATEALNLLQNNPLILEVNMVYEKGFGEINWRWKTDDNSGGRLFFRQEDQLVYAILPGIKSHITLGNVVQIYGEPDYAWVKEINHPNPGNVQTKTPAAYSANIIWVSYGFAISPILTNRSDMLDQYRSTVLTVIFEPSKDSYLTFQGNSGDSMIDWHGYDNLIGYLVP